MIRLYCVQLKTFGDLPTSCSDPTISMDLQCPSEFDAKGLMVYLHSQQGLTRYIELRNVISVQVSQNSNTYVKQHKAGHKLPYKAEFYLFQQHKKLKHPRAFLVFHCIRLGVYIVYPVLAYFRGCLR